MNDGLTARQTQILKALIDEYIKIAEPVGSFALEKKYDLGVSSATIRSEMVNLTKKGYLRQPHTSAGRIPTSVAMKFYIDQLMEERSLSVVDEVKAKEEVWDVRRDFGKLMEEATHALAEKTNSLAVSATDEGDTWSSGYSYIFENPEFGNMEVCRSVFELLEQERRIHELFFEKFLGTPMEVLFGEDLGWDYFEPVGIVATRFATGKKQGAIGVIGPFRLNYSAIIPTVRYFGNLIHELTEG
ncbi:hypothetical protein A3D00_02025 [Candidatus Woesebacteria bacterium RIFCSPHIGHO2_02_FULL_38_9]|uniref:Heat-inducible transcription repressor HrcA n=1 Tax=Candidatus Woesebacteria bacterium RIFCSPHIGHO2_01_FULL_39_28 TaxID=1802496 RepID=A0A1F7YK07_9BACT|nr:MAG: hypothetical protein A2627_04525 [Candidatus Woesebacteria bacterium RIFCSPHIGHO2_01_FULL_39_28]OGM34140.1 MAG: hypothetical protein A3D00_02025 [Candidatus Woesebacteria bacterium RIFCSPHIGHO2_02_FULL_38_9]OGM57055.1 MAG: hypothetical protein A3A50_05330 [Candidatus Woesebacteria bacterium RIFCSPLOWO2_01_FULL_38_20]